MERVRRRFGDYYIANVRAPQISDWREDLLRTGLSVASVRNHLAALSALFSFIEKDLDIPLPAGNPCRSVRKPPQPKGRDRRLRHEELDYLLRAADATKRTPELRHVITLAVETSMRLGELLGLEWGRVDLIRRTAHLIDTKNGESRTVALSSTAVEAFRTLRAALHRIDGRVFGWSASDSFAKGWVRCKARALALYEADCASRGVKPDTAFLADLRFHDLRHEATSRLFEKGLGLMEVASMTGHKSLSMLKRYTHIEAERLAKKLG